MKLLKLSIRNFRCIESLDLDFTDPTGEPLDLVVLAGPNGCGKTSALEAALIALQHEDLLDRARELDIRWGATDYEIKSTIEIEGKRLDRVDRAKTSKPDQPQDTRLPPQENFPVAYFSSWRSPKLVGSIQVTTANGGERPNKSERDRLWRVKQYLVNLMARRAFAHMQDHTPSLKDQIKATETFGRLTKAWSLFYPGRKHVFAVSSDFHHPEEGFDLCLKDDDARTQVSVDHLSSGEIEVLTFLGWFLINDLSNGIVLIDEPELHLHPAWHRTIIRALRTVLPKTQLLCATHSEEVLEMAYSYQRFTLLSEDDPRITMTDGADTSAQAQ